MLPWLSLIIVSVHRRLSLDCYSFIIHVSPHCIMANYQASFFFTVPSKLSVIATYSIIPVLWYHLSWRSSLTFHYCQILLLSCSLVPFLLVVPSSFSVLRASPRNVDCLLLVRETSFLCELASVKTCTLHSYMSLVFSVICLWCSYHSTMKPHLRSLHTTSY